MKNPTHCAIWEKPELVGGMRDDIFETIETYVDESHLMRHLFRCRECGQLYFHEFYEEIDWESGNDPQYTTYIPVYTNEEIEQLKKSSQFELMQFGPRLQKDFPKEAKQPTAWYWLGKEADPEKLN